LGVAMRGFGGWRLLLAVLAALVLGGHATHLPLLLEPATTARADSASGAALPMTDMDEHSRGGGELPCGPHEHCGLEGVLGMPSSPGHDSPCAAGAAADRTRASALPLALPAVPSTLPTLSRIPACIRLALGVPTPDPAGRRALLQVWRI
jgi:hypothetical protein